ncbi:hypothetical protein CPB86DRAFT_451975 [Serendipita vermifera]|nr:hypothetical protein CPB86DRAFT_451975 [Serendipita vermifera]
MALIKEKSLINKKAFNLPPLPSDVVSWAQFQEEIYRLSQQPDWTQFSAIIDNIWKGEKEEIQDIGSRIINVVHEWTGYKFTSKAPIYRDDQLATELSLRCTQRESHLKALGLLLDGLTTGSDIRTETVPCHSAGKITFDHRSCRVSVQLCHDSTQSPLKANIPTKWTQYIIERQTWDPDTLWDEIMKESEQSGGNPLWFDKASLESYLTELTRKPEERRGASSNTLPIPGVLSVDGDNVNGACPSPPMQGQDRNASVICVQGSDLSGIFPPLPSGSLSSTLLEDKLRILGQQPDHIELSMIIDNIWKGEKKEIRDAYLQITALIHAHTGYKFVATTRKYSEKQLVTTMNLHCIQRDTDHQAAQRLRCRRPKMRITERFECHGKAKMTFDHRSRQISLQIVHYKRHPPYMNTSLPTKWAQYVFDRQNSDLDTLWDEMVNQNNQEGGRLLPFTKTAVKRYIDHLLRNNESSGMGSDNEPNTRPEGDDDSNDPCPPPAFIDEEHDEMDIDTWADEGDSIPPVLPPLKDSDESSNEGPDDHGAILPGSSREVSQEVNGNIREERDDERIKVALDFLTSLGRDMDPDEAEEFDASLLILKRVIRRHQQRSWMA